MDGIDNQPVSDSSASVDCGRRTDSNDPGPAVREFLAWVDAAPRTSAEIAEQLQAFDPHVRITVERIFSDAAAQTDIHRFSESVIKDQDGQPLQTREIDLFIHRHIDECRRDGLYCGILAPVGCGKALAIDTPIPTPGGYRTMGTLKAGDVVFDRKGQPCAVTWVSDIQLGRKAYTVTFDDGVVVKADADHQWLCWTKDDLRGPRKQPRGKKPYCPRPAANKIRRAEDGLRIVSTQEMVDGGLHTQRPCPLDRGRTTPIRTEWKWYHPIPKPVQYPERDLPIHPYVLGVWLGDGDAAGTAISYHYDDRAIVERCVTLEHGIAGPPLRRERNNWKRSIGGRLGMTLDPNRLRQRLRQLDLLRNKHIPEIYLLSSEKQRRELLAGLLDTDGSVARNGKVIEFCSVIPALARKTLELVRSLGFKATILRHKSFLYGVRKKDRWRVTFTARVPLFRLQRKLDRQKLDGDTRWTRHRKVVSIEQIPSEPMRCISVDSPDSSYLFGHSYAVTHNSTRASVIYALWELCKDPNRLIMLISSTDDEAKKRLVKIGQVIMHDKDFARVMGHKIRPSQTRVRSEDEWSNHKLSVERTSGSVEPSVQACGVRSSLPGSRCHLMIFDDAIDQRIALESPALKKLVREKIDHQWQGRIILQDHFFIWIATRWTEDDQSGIFMKNPRWRFLQIEVSDNFEHLIAKTIERDTIINTTTLALPTKWTPQMLRDEVTAKGELAFNRQYRQRPWSQSDRMFPNFDLCVRPELSLDTERKAAASQGWRVFTGVDVSSKRRRGCAVVTIGVDHDGRSHLLDSRIGRWTQSELGLQINDVDARFHPLVIAVEDNAIQDSFIDSWQTTRGTYHFWQKIQPFTTTGAKKKDADLGLRAFDVAFANGSWVFAAAHLEPHANEGGDHLPKCGECLLFSEIRWHPVYQSKDLLMALWFARNMAVQFSGLDEKAVKQILDEVPEDKFFDSQLDSIGIARSIDEEDDNVDEAENNLYPY